MVSNTIKQNWIYCAVHYCDTNARDLTNLSYFKIFLPVLASIYFEGFL